MYFSLAREDGPARAEIERDDSEMAETLVDFVEGRPQRDCENRKAETQLPQRDLVQHVPLGLAPNVQGLRNMVLAALMEEPDWTR